MDATPPPSPNPEPDNFDLYWDRVIFDSDVNTIIVKPEGGAPLVWSAPSPLGFENLMTLLCSKNVIRYPLRTVLGRPAHVYGLGFYPNDDEGRAEMDAAPYNEHGSELLSRCGLEAEVRGPLIIVHGDAIDPRDMQVEMIDADAETMPEIERDHILKIAPAAEREWAKVEQALDDGLIPAVLDATPTLHRVSWLLRVLFVALDRDIVSHAALQELGAKNPKFHQAAQALWNIQAAHFAGRIEELAPADDEDGTETMFAAVKTPPPPGFSKRYQKVLH